MANHIHFRFKTAKAFATGPEAAQVLIGDYLGVPDPEEDDLYDLYRMDAQGEPVGEPQGRMRSEGGDAGIVTIE